MPDRDFAGMMPGLLAIFDEQGWLALIWGILLLPIALVPYGLRLVRRELGELAESLGSRASASTGGPLPT
ncbi:MAG: hypothetical protein U0X73_05685 [Thermoanaerobaculia bacterium]